ncbi:MAG: COX15/CtaA family protein [Vulcanococcus sp.]
MTSIGLGSATPLRARLAALSAHLLVALVALVAIGGATRVMEAGLACPDWPLCYGTLLPGRQMNLQVFLEWFHRLDAFVVGVGLLVLAAVSCWCRRQLPALVPALSLAAVALVALQGTLGALTVTLLLPFSVVTAHLVTALLLVALLSACTQALWLAPRQATPAPTAPQGLASAWPWLTAGVALLVLLQCALGGLMATQWAAGSCLASGDGCGWLWAHRLGARGAGLAVLALAGGGLWWRPQERPLAALAAALVLGQIALGVVALRLSLSAPAVTVAHQIGAALLVAVLAALVVRSRPIAGPAGPILRLQAHG